MLDSVLATIDDHLASSLERLFALLRIESISTDPAYAGSCRTAAEWLTAELSAMGFAAGAAGDARPSDRRRPSRRPRTRT